jgi:hypothetical protein
MEEESWMMTHVGGIIEDKSYGIREEKWWRRNHGGGIIHEESCRRNRGGGGMGKESWRRNHGEIMEEEPRSSLRTKVRHRKRLGTMF